MPNTHIKNANTPNFTFFENSLGNVSSGSSTNFCDGMGLFFQQMCRIHLIKAYSSSQLVIQYLNIFP